MPADLAGLLVITGKGIHAKRGQSVLFAAVHKMRTGMNLDFRCPGGGGRFKVVVDPADKPRIASYKLDTKRPRMLVSNLSNVETRHWHRETGKGVDRRRHIAQDKQRQHRTNERTGCSSPLLVQ